MLRRGFAGVVMLWLLIACDPERGFVDPYSNAGPATFPEELADYRDAVESSRRQYLRIEPSPARATGPLASKFRGVPYLPEGEGLPVDASGEPLVLLAQINFADAPPLERFPDRGILQFFIQSGVTDEHVWGLVHYSGDPWIPADYFRNLQRQDYFRVRYYPEPEENGQRGGAVPTGSDTGDMPITGEMSLRFVKDEELVSPEDHAFASYVGGNVTDLYERYGDEVIVELHRFLDNDAPAKIGGYGRFVQQDPREAVEEGDEWLVLLNIESFSAGEAQSMWGDAGTATFMIRGDDLERRDFSRVLYYWDNH